MNYRTTPRKGDIPTQKICYTLIHAGQQDHQNLLTLQILSPLSTSKLGHQLLNTIQISVFADTYAKAYPEVSELDSIISLAHANQPLPTLLQLNCTHNQLPSTWQRS